MRSIKSFQDVQTAFNSIDTFVSKWTSQVWNLSGRQIKNGGAATDPTDFVILKQLQASAESSKIDLNTLPVPLSRTYLIKDTTVRNDAGDHIVVFGNGGPYTAHFFFGVLRKRVTADLTIRVHHVFQGIDTSLGNFTIPATQNIDDPIRFAISSKLIDRAVLTWDILNSDGSQDPDGIASFTIVWF